MANVSAPRGLVPARFLSGAPYNGSARVYYVPSSYATAIYVGDPVIATGAGDAFGIPVANVATAAGGNYITGVCCGIVNGGDPVNAVTRDLPLYRQASTSQYILVADDPNLLFWAQEDGVGGAMGTGAAMGNVDLISGSGSTATGYSGWMLDSSTLNTTNTLQMRILEPYGDYATNDPTSAYAKWLVKINLHSLNNLTGL